MLKRKQCKEKEPVFLDEISEEELNKKIDEGLKDIEEGRVYTQEEVDVMFEEKHDI